MVLQKDFSIEGKSKRPLSAGVLARDSGTTWEFLCDPRGLRGSFLRGGYTLPAIEEAEYKSCMQICALPVLFGSKIGLRFPFLSL